MNYNKIILFIVCCLFSLSCCDPIPVKDCGTTGVTLNSFDISGCKKFPCPFPKGTNITLNLNVTAKQPFKSVTNLCFGILSGVKVPFPLPQPNACTNGVSCPISAGTTFSQSLTVPILQIYPSIAVVVQIELHDESDNKIYCGQFPALIK